MDRGDFLRLFFDLNIHNGLIILVPNVARADQSAFSTSHLIRPKGWKA